MKQQILEEIIEEDKRIMITIVNVCRDKTIPDKDKISFIEQWLDSRVNSSRMQIKE
jgi:hypothetical protein